jgi:hypothetical protein
VRRDRHEQAFGTLATGTLDALRDPVRIQYRASGGDPIIDNGVMMAKETAISGWLFVVRGPDGLDDGVDQVMCPIEIGSCSLQEEQML